MVESLKVIGDRVRYHRIQAEHTQIELAEMAAVSVDTLASLEKGKSISTENFCRILKVLGLEEGLISSLPKKVISPLDLQKLQGKERKRVRK